MRRMVYAVAILTALTAVIPRQAIAATIAAMDSFEIIRNGLPFFSDPFADGLEPPSAPNFSSGTPGSYSVFGTFPNTAETGGKLQLNSALGQLFVNAAGVGRQSQAATLGTNIDPTNTTAGLKQNFAFSIQGLFDLTAPADLLGNYGIDIFDRATGIPGDEQLQVDVARSADGRVRVRFLRQDFLTDTITVIGQQLVDFALGDQIMLSIDHATAGSTNLTGSFQYFAGGVAVDGITDLGTSTMFRGENWILSNFFASQAVPEPGTLMLLGAGLAVLGGMCRRRKATKGLKRETAT